MRNEATKDPGANLDYVLDWSTSLGPDTIASSTWSVPTGLIQGAISSTPKTTTIWLSGGTVGVAYRITNRIVTTGGRTDEWSFAIYVEER